MNSTTKKGLRLFTIALAAGIGLIGLAYTPFINKPQCGDVVNQDCVVGVNMGAATLWMLGIFFGFVGLVGLVGILVYILVIKLGNKA